jgi:transposase
MPQQRKPNDLSRSLIALDMDTTLIAVVELSLASWLVAGIVPGVERQPLKKLKTDENALLALLNRWRDEAVRSRHKISRIAVAFEAGRDGFWLARWLKARGIEAHVIHASSVAVSREHRRAKTDRLDTELLKRAFVGWLRGERDHCKMASIPNLREEDAKRPSRERESLVGEQSRLVNRMKATLIRLGIRGFNPKLKHAEQRLETLRTPEGEPMPPTLWLSSSGTCNAGGSSASKSGESSRSALSVWSGHPTLSHMPWCACWHASPASASKPPTCLCTSCCYGTCAIAGRLRATEG